jgi:hypothetical protein
MRCLLGPVSDFLCDECDSAGRQPYEFLVHRVAMLAPKLPEPLLLAASPMRVSVASTLVFLERTEEVFLADVNNVREQNARNW